MIRQRRAAAQLVLTAALLAWAGTTGCHRGAPAGTIAILPPFSERGEVVWLRPHWRQAAGGTPVVEVWFDAENKLHSPLYLRLANPRLVDRDGQIVATAIATGECRLASGSTLAMWRAELPLAAPASEGVSVAVDALAIPLAEPGRAMYREWAWLRRPREVAAIDAELSAFDALPLCASAAFPVAP